MRWAASLCLLAAACADPAPKKSPKNLVEAGDLSFEVLNGILTTNETPLMRLTNGSLSTEALAQNNELPPAILSNPGFAQFFGYLVQCALPDTETITVTSSTGQSAEFQGGIGLAEEWADGPCDEACQEWVSACLFARSNS